MPVIVTNCYDLSKIHVPSLYKVSMLYTEDFDRLKAVYKFLYNDVSAFIFTRTIKVIKTVRIYDQQLGSMHNSRNMSSSYIMPLWARADRNILLHSAEDGSITRPGHVLHYILNNVKVGATYRKHLFVVVVWFK